MGGQDLPQEFRVSAAFGRRVIDAQVFNDRKRRAVLLFGPRAIIRKMSVGGAFEIQHFVKPD